MTDAKVFGLVLVGMAIGALAPIEARPWSWIIPLSIATFFIGIDLFWEFRGVA